MLHDLELHTEIKCLKKKNGFLTMFPNRENMSLTLKIKCRKGGQALTNISVDVGKLPNLKAEWSILYEKCVTWMADRLGLPRHKDLWHYIIDSPELRNPIGYQSVFVAIVSLYGNGRRLTNTNPIVEVLFVMILEARFTATCIHLGSYLNDFTHWIILL